MPSNFENYYNRIYNVSSASFPIKEPFYLTPPVTTGIYPDNYELVLRVVLKEWGDLTITRKDIMEVDTTREIVTAFNPRTDEWTVRLR